MIGAIIGVESGKRFASLGTLSADTFGDMVCDLLVSDGDSSIGDSESSGGKCHTVSSSKGS
jgi:hypothetical protein